MNPDFSVIGLLCGAELHRLQMISGIHRRCVYCKFLKSSHTVIQCSYIIFKTQHSFINVHAMES